jgi:glutaconate CoA-transferase subunit B
VDKVDYISHPGKKVCRENEFYGGGPKWIVTPKCIFDFDPDTLEARLAMTFPGITVDDVKANTGFEVKVAKKVEGVQPPTKDELDALRNEVDKTGVLRH